MVNNLKLNCPHECQTKNILLSNLSLHEQKQCNNYFINCEHNCGKKILYKNANNHIHTNCELTNFFKTNLSIFIQPNISDTALAIEIRKFFEAVYKSKFMVFVDDISQSHNMVYDCMYCPPFKRIEDVDNRYHIIIYKQSRKENDIPKGNIMTKDDFKAFFKGLILNIVIDNNGTLKEVRQSLERVLGGYYAVFKNPCSLGLTYFCGHDCSIIINDDIFAASRTG